MRTGSPPDKGLQFLREFCPVPNLAVSPVPVVHVRDDGDGRGDQSQSSPPCIHEVTRYSTCPTPRQSRSPLENFCRWRPRKFSGVMGPGSDPAVTVCSMLPRVAFEVRAEGMGAVGQRLGLRLVQPGGWVLMAAVS